MDLDNCNIHVQFGIASSVNPVFVRPCSTLVEAIHFILFNNNNQNNNQTLSENEKRIFDILEQFAECPQKMFMNLIKHFTEFYDIDLYIINFDGTKFNVLNRDNYLKENSKANIAFLSFNEDNTVCGPLRITIDNDTVQTIFSNDVLYIWHNIDDYLDELNKSKSESTNNSIQMMQYQDPIENSTTEQVSTFKTQTNLANSVQADDKAEIRGLIEQLLKPLAQLLDRLSLKPETLSSIIHSPAFTIDNVDQLSHKDIIYASKNQVNYLLDLINNEEQSSSILQNDGIILHQSVFPDDRNNQPIQDNTSTEMDFALQTVSLSTNTSVIPLTTYIPDNIEFSNTFIPREPMPLEMQLNSPTLLIEPKDDWHPRTLQDLKNHDNPLLQGEGSQRTPILIEIPATRIKPTFLGFAICTFDNQCHISKVAVAEKTQVKPNFCLKDNNLECLEFNKCVPITYFDPITRYNYSEISEEEHAARSKEVRFHVFNLYQSGIITKVLIKEKQLNLFKLALWFCFCENGEYKRVSPVLLTQVIREKCVGGRKVKNISDSNTT